MSARQPATRSYEVRVDGHLDESWSAWFDGMDLVREDDGATALRGRFADQAELHGVLARVRDLGLTLLSVTATDVVETRREDSLRIGGCLPPDCHPRYEQC